MAKSEPSKFAAAAVIYAGFAVYLYQPHFKDFDKLQYLLVVNVCLASLGCFLLSRRWLSKFAGSFFAGAIYGFGPFALDLAKFHPTAALMTAAIPWLFCPAAFWQPFFRRKRSKCEPEAKLKWRWVSVPLSVLPFLAIVLFFGVSARVRLFPIPTQVKLHLADLACLPAPLVMMKQSLTLVGFYHVPIAALIMGVSILLTARRLGIAVIFTAGTILAFCDSFLDISPIIWLAIPLLCCSVLIGIGMEALALAGPTDKNWVLATAVIMTVLSITALLLAPKYYNIFAGLGAKHANLLVNTAKMYILGAVAAAIIFFMARAKLRIAALRWLVLCSAMAVDIFLGARFIVDKIF